MRCLGRVGERNRLGSGRVRAEYGHALVVQPDRRGPADARLRALVGIIVSALFPDLSGTYEHSVTGSDAGPVAEESMRTFVAGGPRQRRARPGVTGQASAHRGNSPGQGVWKERACPAQR